MKIKVLHYYTKQDVYGELGVLTRYNRSDYCKKHGYDLVVDTTDYSGTVDDTTFLHNTKFSSIKNNMHSCDYLVWIDSDILIVNEDVKLEEFITTKSISCAPYNRYVPNPTLHNGVIIFKNDNISNFYINLCCDTFVHEGAQRRHLYKILDEDVSNYIVGQMLPVLTSFIGYIDFSKIYSNVYGIANVSRCPVLRAYEPGDYILHLSNPLPPKLKLYYARKYIELCEKYRVGHILPVDILTHHMKELGLASNG